MPDNWGFVISAYAITWIAIGAYALAVLRRRSALEDES